MNEMRFTVQINANRKQVWETLWRDDTFRQWAGIIDPGTHLEGELKEGEKVQFISGNGYGVSSLVAKLVAGEFLLLRHQADTQDNGKRERDEQWTGGEESYALAENDGATTLTVTFGVPPELEDEFRNNYPKALECVKLLAEKGTGQPL